MAIRQHLQWLDSEKKFSGFINFGKVDGNNSNSLPLASQAIVFLISGINMAFHIPIAFHFISKLDGIDKVILMKLIIKKLTEIGIRVISATFDGDPANITACEIMGSQFDNRDLKPEFKCDDENLLFPFLDPPHMLKLIRNHLASCRTIYDRNGQSIEWEYFEKLVLLKEEENLGTHKMTKCHINFHSNKMKVLLAVQTFSESCASTMQSLYERNYPGFENVRGTMEFCRRMNKLFDIQNSDVQRDDNLFKSPINERTRDEIFNFLDDMTDYLKKLTFEKYKNPIIESNIKVGFKGMLINIANIKKIYSELVLTKILDEFPVRRICQCPLESLFSRLRSYSLLGFNTNPTVQQFKASIQKISVKNEITSSKQANCSDHLNILDVTSFVPPKGNSIDSNIQFDFQNQQQVEQPVDNDESSITDHGQIDEILFSEENSTNSTIGIAYIAGQIEMKIQSEKKENSALFTKVFEECEKLPFENVFPKTKQSRIPCRSSYQICISANEIIEEHLLKCDFNYPLMLDIILSGITSQSVFVNEHFDGQPEKKFQLVQSIVEKYISMRANYLARKVTLEHKVNKMNSRKNTLNKIKHFQGR